MHPLKEIRQAAERLAAECNAIAGAHGVYTEEYRRMADETLTALLIAVEATRPEPPADRPVSRLDVDGSDDVVIRSADGLRRAILTIRPPF